MQQKKSQRIALVLLTAGALLVNIPGCVKQRDDDDDNQSGGGTFYLSSGQSWGSYHSPFGGYQSFGRSRGGFGSSSGFHGGSGGHS